MKRFFKSISMSVALLLSLSMLAACSTKQPAKLENNQNGSALTVLKVGASPEPHGEIIKFIIPLMKEKGIDLQLVEFTDYIQPNLALINKDIDANYFQHTPYLNDFNKENNSNLVVAADLHFEPLGLFPGKIKSLDQITDGVTIAVPNDTTNEARALYLLELAGLIKVNHEVGFKATINDMTENNKNIKFTELEAAQVPRSLQDVDFAVINGNFALQANLIPSKDALITEGENSEAAKTYVNILAIRAGDDTRPEIKTLVDVLKSDATRDFINTKYKGSVIPMF